VAINRSRSRVFLIELLCCVLIFVLCAVVALQIFAAARQTSDNARALSVLNTQAANIAETYKADKGDVARLIRDAQMAALPDGTLALYYDVDLHRVDAGSSAVYELVCSKPTVAEHVEQMALTIRGNGQTLEGFTVSVAKGETV
jgi:type II secretory pathway pseudopilin PulG